MDSFTNADKRKDFRKQLRILGRFPLHNTRILSILENKEQHHDVDQQYALQYRSNIILFILERGEQVEQMFDTLDIDIFSDPYYAYKIRHYDTQRNLLQLTNSVTFAKQYLEYLAKHENNLISITNLVNSQDTRGETPIVHAININSLDLAKLYFEYKAILDPEYILAWDGILLKIKSVPMFQLFSQHCRKHLLQSIVDDSIQSLLHIISLGEEAFDVIMSQVNVKWNCYPDLLTSYEFTLCSLSTVKKLIHLIESEDRNALKQMFNNNESNRYMESTAMKLINISHPFVYKYLVNHPLCEPFSQNATRNNALHSCTKPFVDIKLIKALVTCEKLGNIDAENNKHYTPLQLLCDQQFNIHNSTYPDINSIKLFIDYGANPMRINRTEKKNAIDFLLKSLGNTIPSYYIELLEYILNRNVRVYNQYGSHFAYKLQNPDLELIVTRFLQNKLGPLFKHATQQWLIDIEIVCTR
jgi:hypothetical protein